MMVKMGENKNMICALKETGVLPVITSNEIDYWQRIMTIAYRNNIRVIEFTHPRDSRSLNLFLHLLESCQTYPGLKIGVGTVLNTAAASKYLQAGASFIA